MELFRILLDYCSPVQRGDRENRDVHDQPVWRKHTLGGRGVAARKIGIFCTQKSRSKSEPQNHLLYGLTGLIKVFFYNLLDFGRLRLLIALKNCGSVEDVEGRGGVHRRQKQQSSQVRF